MAYSILALPIFACGGLSVSITMCLEVVRAYSVQMRDQVEQRKHGYKSLVHFVIDPVGFFGVDIAEPLSFFICQAFGLDLRSFLEVVHISDLLLLDLDAGVASPRAV